METPRTPLRTAPAGGHARSLARERRKAMILAIDLLRHTGRRLIEGTGGAAQPFEPPVFETVGEEVAVGSSLLALANRLEPDRQRAVTDPINEWIEGR